MRGREEVREDGSREGGPRPTPPVRPPNRSQSHPPPSRAAHGIVSSPCGHTKNLPVKGGGLCQASPNPATSPAPPHNRLWRHTGNPGDMNSYVISKAPR
ncbi:hypothetical protein O3P69_015218 [Scylla paramamosain]|uniref:Uncharacterized protein n=1 Tax=Scylla paramamosain TaxID=85552 RepID=A0AAW0T4H7_SCYPA